MNLPPPDQLPFRILSKAALSLPKVSRKEIEAGALRLPRLKRLGQGMNEALHKVPSLGCDHPDGMPRYNQLVRRYERHVAQVKEDPSLCSGSELANFANYVVKQPRWMEDLRGKQSDKTEFLAEIPAALRFFGFSPEDIACCWKRVVDPDSICPTAEGYLYGCVMRSLYQYFRALGFDHDTLTR